MYRYYNGRPSDQEIRFSKRIYLISIISLAILLFASCKKVDQKQDDFSFDTEEHFDIIDLSIYRSDALSIGELYFRIKHNTDTIRCTIPLVFWGTPNSIISIVSDTSNLIDAHSTTYWDTTLIQDERYLIIHTALPLHFKLEFYDNADRSETHGAKIIHLHITPETEITLANSTRLEMEQMNESKDKMIEVVNTLMQSINDIDRYTSGIQPFEAVSYLRTY
jgi:hypothetical protein